MLYKFPAHPIALVVDDSLVDFPSRLETVLESTHVSGSIEDGGPAYEQDSIVPGYTSASCPRIELLVHGHGHIPDSFVALVDLKEVVQPLHDLKIITLENVARCSYDKRISLWAMELMQPYLASRWGNQLHADMQGASVDRPNFRTLSVDHRTGLRVGIHIDTWEMKPISSRWNEKYRMIVNVGAVPRYFVFSPEPSDSFLSDEAWKRHIELGVPFSPTKQLREWSKSHTLPFFRLRVQPGEACIAPTDLIAHDGSTHGTEVCGAHYAIRADFRGCSRQWWKSVAPR